MRYRQAKKTIPVIFDIVLNIENLYSIGAIEDKMQVATAYYRSRGEGDKIAVENFRIYDEVRECKLLFNRLNDALSASWECMYSVAKRYYETHGNLEVEKRYITDEGYSIGSWLNTQRLVYAGKSHGILTDEQVEKLNAIGMRWESVKDVAWEKFYSNSTHPTQGALCAIVAKKLQRDARKRFHCRMLCYHH